MKVASKLGCEDNKVKRREENLLKEKEHRGTGQFIKESKQTEMETNCTNSCQGGASPVNYRDSENMYERLKSAAMRIERRRQSQQIHVRSRYQGRREARENSTGPSETDQNGDARKDERSLPPTWLVQMK